MWSPAAAFEELTNLEEIQISEKNYFKQTKWYIHTMKYYLAKIKGKNNYQNLKTYRLNAHICWRETYFVVIFILSPRESKLNYNDTIEVSGYLSWSEG